MFSIQINKTPISYLEISDDLNTLKVFLDISYTEANKDNFYQIQFAVSKLIQISPYLPLGTQANTVFVFGLKQLKTNANDINDSQLHQVQQVIERLHQKNFIVNAQLTDINNFVTAKMAVYQQKLEQNAGIISAVNLLLLEAAALGDDLCRWNYHYPSLFETLNILEKIKYHDGNLEKIGASLLYLLLHEGAANHFVKSLSKSGIDPDFFKKATQLKMHVLEFITQHETKIVDIIENDIHRNANWFQNLYQDYKAQKTNAANQQIEPKFYGPITNKPGLGIVLFPIQNNQLKTKEEHHIASKQYA